MFNMYDDEGSKFKISDPYEIKKLQKITPLHNKVDERKEQNGNNSAFEGYLNKDDLNKEATDAYKKMANIHFDEEVFHAFQLMHHTIVTVQDSNSILECWKKMEENDLKQIPVVGIDGKIKGLATMKNITSALIDNINNPNYSQITSISKIMIQDVVTAEPIADIRRISKVMVQYHLNSIPIVDSRKDEVVGIISRADILRAVSTHPHFQLWA